MFEVLQTIRDSIAGCIINTPTILHEQHEQEFDIMNCVREPEYYPALAIQVGRGEYLDILVCPDTIIVMTCRRVGDDFYRDGVSEDQYFALDDPAAFDQFIAVLAADGVNLTVAPVAA